jgi:hypothetical protein
LTESARTVKSAMACVAGLWPEQRTLGAAAAIYGRM